MKTEKAEEVLKRKTSIGVVKLKAENPQMFNNIIKAMEAYHSQFSSAVESSSVEEVFKRTTNIELKEMKVENPRMFRNIKRAMEKYHEQFTPLEN